MGTCTEPFTPKMLFPYTILAAIKSASPSIVCAPVRYVPEAIVWFDVPGVMVAALLVVTDEVRDTAEFPAVPEATYPADTCGVLLTVFDNVRVFVPVETEAPVADMLDAGDADPDATVPLALLE